MIEVVAAVVVGVDRRVLLVRKAGTEAFMNPGGKPEAGESLVQALCRELAEELDLDVETDELMPWGRFETDAANEPGERLGAYCFQLELGERGFRVGAEIAEARWVDPASPDPGLVLAPLAARFLLPRAAAI